jgi:hypothetical protein
VTAPQPSPPGPGTPARSHRWKAPPGRGGPAAGPGSGSGARSGARAPTRSPPGPPPGEGPAPPRDPDLHRPHAHPDGALGQVAVTVAPELGRPLLSGPAQELLHLGLQGGLEQLLGSTSNDRFEHVLGCGDRCGGRQDLLLCRHGVAPSADPFQRVSPTVPLPGRLRRRFPWGQPTASVNFHNI